MKFKKKIESVFSLDNSWKRSSSSADNDNEQEIGVICSTGIKSSCYDFQPNFDW